MPAIYWPPIMLPCTWVWYVPGNRGVSAMARRVWKTGAVWWVLGFCSNTSSQVISVLGKNTTTFCGTRTTVLLSSIHPPVILHCAGNGGLAGVGAGLSSLLHSPGDA